MPAPELDKDNYNPDEVHNLIKTSLGDDAAMYFRMMYNKVHKVPPHKIRVKELSEGTEMLEYQFRMQDYMEQIGLPEELINFVMVISDRHGGGGKDNMGWVRLDYKTLDTPEGTIPIAVADEIQSDFSQRINRLRKSWLGRLTEEGEFNEKGEKISSEGLLSYEKAAWEAIKNNPQLMTVEKAIPQEAQVGFPQGAIENVDNFILEKSGPNTVRIFEGSHDSTGYRGYYGRGEFYPKSGFSDFTPPYSVRDKAVEMLKSEDKESSEKVTYKPTPELKNSINKIESTGYSDILNYLFNKAVGFAKSRGAKKLFIPTAENMAKRWGVFAGAGADIIYKRVYDSNAAAYGGIKSPYDEYSDYYVIDLDKVGDVRLAKKLRLSVYWKDPNGAIDSKNWKETLPSFINVFFQTFINKYKEMPPEDQEYYGSTMYEETSDASILYEAFDHLYEYLEKNMPALIGNSEATQMIKSILSEKFNFEMPPEKESKLMLLDSPIYYKPEPILDKPKSEEVLDTPSAEELETWLKPKKVGPKSEEVEGAPSAEELEKQFKWSKRNKFKGYE
jgi:hypothetical protein